MQEDKNAMRFPQKLWYLLNMGSNAIMWGHTGKTILLNYRILHGYLQSDQSVFKTANISSFVRQLNLYGFRKVTSHLQDPVCNSSNPYMHEYVHDYFQVGHQELLNKITRKALTIRKHSHKPKSMLLTMNRLNQPSDQYLTPLQKARQALQIALRNAAENMFMQHSPKVPGSFNFNNDVDTDGNMAEHCKKDEPSENEFDWIVHGEENKENIPPPRHLPEINEMVISPPADPPGITEITPNYGNSSQEQQDAYMNLTPTPSYSQPSAEFSGPFLSMPDLDTEPADNPDVKLLAEFNIDQEIDQGIVRKTGDKSYHNSMNCVLPSISAADSIDDVTMAQRAAEDCASNHYNDGEWDQMMNDIITSRGSGSECGSDLKELYSQISRTIYLLNM